MTPDMRKALASWHRATPEERRQRRQLCRDKGHRFLEVPFSTPDRPTHICRDCITYHDPQGSQPVPIPPPPEPILPKIHPHWLNRTT